MTVVTSQAFEHTLACGTRPVSVRPVSTDARSDLPVSINRPHIAAIDLGEPAP